MNWTISRSINNYNELSPPEMMPRDKKLNKHKLFRMVSKHELACLNPTQLLEWRRQNTPQESSSNDTSTRTRHTIISGWRRKINSRRLSKQNENASLLSVHKVFSRLYHNLQENASEEWKSRAACSKNRAPHVAAIEDDNVRNNSKADFQIKTLNLSYGHLERHLGQRLCRANIATHNDNYDGARVICSPNKVKIKKQTIIKMNLDLSLMACSFG